MEDFFFAIHKTDPNLTDCGNPKLLERSGKIISAGNKDHGECFNPNQNRKQLKQASRLLDAGRLDAGLCVSPEQNGRRPPNPPAHC
jgi:hypothetical protein